MQKLQSRLTLLALFSIFFVYKTIDAAISNKASEAYLWVLITFVYLISLIVAFFVFKKFEKEQKI